MPILRMQTDIVRETATQLTQNANLLEAEMNLLNQSTQQLMWEWSGGGSDTFASEITALLNQLGQLSAAGVDLAVRLEKEVVEWEETSAYFGVGGAVSGFLAGTLFGHSIGNAVSGIINGLFPEGIHIKESPKVNLDKDIYENLGGDLYKLNIDDLDKFDPVKAAEGLDTGGRPVLFLVHGIDFSIAGNSNEPHDVAFQKAYEQIVAKYPKDKRPIVVGIEWDAGGVDVSTSTYNGISSGLQGLAQNTWEGAKKGVNEGLQDGQEFNDGGILGGIKEKVIGGVSATAKGTYYGVKDGLVGGGSGFKDGLTTEYRQSNEKASQTSEEFGAFLHQFNKNHPETSVNVITHSLGTKMVMESIQQDGVDANIDNFLAIQGAVDVEQMNSTGLYNNVLHSGEVKNFGATHTDSGRGGDLPLRFHEFTYDDSLGRNADQLENVKLYDMDNTNDQAIDFNHYGLNSEIIHNKVIPDFFSGENPFGRRKDSL